MEKLYYTAKEVAEMLDVSVSHAYIAASLSLDYITYSNSKHEFAKYSLMDFFRQNIFSDGFFYL